MSTGLAGRAASIAPSSRDKASHALAALLEARGSESIAIAAVPAPLAPVEALLRATDDEPVVLFAPPDGPSVVGVGVSHELRARGPGRFAEVRDAAREAFASMRVLRGIPGFGPRFYGGFAFADGGAEETPWSAFGDGALVLPRFTYVVADGQAFLALAATRDLRVTDALAELDVLWDRLERGAESARSARPTNVEHETVERWSTHVEALLAALHEGRLAKAVAARRSTVSFAGEVVPGDVLARLRRRFPACTRFAMRRGQATFLGATPERLVTRVDASIASEALAGSIGRGGAARLLASDKDRIEHRLVVESIAEALRPFCDELRVAEEPGIRELANVVHMHTPIEGRARGDAHVLDLVAALHPTPAVGGVPRDEALRLIAANEPTARGWYAGPFGWLDERGDGSFVVALRSALLFGAEAWAYAGAGIVADSEPRAEYDETAMKMQAILGSFDGDTL